jgi:hypothetical protein
MRTTQIATQRTSKANGHGGAGGAASDFVDNASSDHAVDRVAEGETRASCVAPRQSGTGGVTGALNRSASDGLGPTPEWYLVGGKSCQGTDLRQRASLA